MEGMVLALALLACPVAIALMMSFIGQGMRKSSRGVQPADTASAAELRRLL